MNLRNFLQIIILSFYSKDLYLSVAYRWKHWGLNFLLKFSILVSIITSIILFILISTFNFDDTRPLLSNFPPLKIENNHAFIDESKFTLPILLKYPNSKSNFIVVDLDAVDAKKYTGQSTIIFTKNKIIFSEVEDFALSYRDLLVNTDITILNEETIIKLLQIGQNKLLNILLFLGIPLGSLLYFVATIFKSLLYALIASLLAKICLYNLNLKQLMRLAIVTNTPAFFIQAFLLIISFGFGDITRAIAENIYLFYFTYIFVTCGRSTAMK